MRVTVVVVGLVLDSNYAASICETVQRMRRLFQILVIQVVLPLPYACAASKYEEEVSLVVRSKANTPFACGK